MGAAGAGHPVSMPLHVYKLYPDGHEELIRGVRLRGLNARSLKDILAAGDDSVTFSYMENDAPFALLGYGASSAEVSVVAPSVLIDDLELTKVDDELPRVPIAPPQRQWPKPESEDPQQVRLSGDLASSFLATASLPSSFSCRT